MKTNYRKLPALLTICLVAFPLVALTGCQTGLFQKPNLPKVKAPDFSKLAFWKKR